MELNGAPLKDIAATDIHFASQNTADLEVFLFNVGQGDHILLRFPSGEYGIIDFHYAGNETIVEPPSLSYFKMLKNKLTEEEFEKITIAFFCVSHTDKDHVKGIVETIEWFDEKGVFIRDFWLGAAHDEAQLTGYLKERIPAVIKQAGLLEQIDLNKSSELLSNETETFFDRFEDWRLKKFKSPRYASEELGTGEYLAEIREVGLSVKNCRAVNVGPMIHHLKDFITRLDIDLVRKILGVKTADEADKNLMSHILRIRFGKTNLLFGGDTHRDIWEECLRKYNRSSTPYPDIHGPLDSHFIKVSHHGSANSSSQDIWQDCIPKENKVFMGISAGQNQSYKHPSNQTIADIRNVRSDANILVTNFCTDCILKSHYEKEYHAWYDEYVTANYEDQVANTMIKRISKKSHKLPEQLGLFAYIFTVAADPEQEIAVRIALSRVNGGPIPCFYKDRNETVFDPCKNSPADMAGHGR